MELSLCNIYAPNDHADQLRFIKELNNYLIGKSELTALIVGGDWNCTLTKKDKKGGLPWRPSGFRNSILVTMDIFDLEDIQRVKHPNVNCDANDYEWREDSGFLQQNPIFPSCSWGLRTIVAWAAGELEAVTLWKNSDVKEALANKSQALTVEFIHCIWLSAHRAICNCTIIDFRERVIIEEW